MPSKPGNRASSAGTCRPAWAIIARRPTVFSATVLPPAFGPVISSTPRSESIDRLMGTTAALNPAAPASSGCRARLSRRRRGASSAASPSSRPASPSSTSSMIGGVARSAEEYWALATSRSSRATMSSASIRSSPVSPTRIESWRSTRSTSRSSARRASRHRFPMSTAAIGSTNTVAPLSDTS